MMSLGIVLFVAGFIMTLAAVPSVDSARASDGAHLQGTNAAHSGPIPQIYLITGMSVSFAGVVLATVGPAMGLVKANSKE